VLTHQPATLKSDAALLTLTAQAGAVGERCHVLSLHAVHMVPLRRQTVKGLQKTRVFGGDCIDARAQRGALSYAVRCDVRLSLHRLLQ
jgi:hypothetical protein